MPNRYIRASAIESEPVNALTWQGEVFYRRLLNRADDFGRYTGNLSLLRASLFPLQLEKVSVSNVGRLLAECETAGLVFGYQSGGKPYLVLNKWEQGRAKHSEYPEPPPEVVERMQTYVFMCKHAPTHVPDTDTDSNSDDDAAAFDRFWESYPKKTAKEKSRESFLREKCPSCIDAVLAGLERDRRSAQWCKDDGQFIPHPTTWLNQRRWESSLQHELLEAPKATTPPVKRIASPQETYGA